MHLRLFKLTAIVLFLASGLGAALAIADVDTEAQVRDILTRIEAGPHVITPDHLADLDQRIEAASGEAKLALLSWRAFYIDEFSETEEAIIYNQRLAQMASEMNNQRYMTIARLERVYLDNQHTDDRVALQRMQEAMDEALASGDPAVIANAYVDFSYTAARAGQTNFAMQMLESALGYLAGRPEADWQRLEVFGALIYAGSSARDIEIIIDSLSRLLDAAENLDVRIAGDIEAFNMARVFLDFEDFELAHEVYSRLEVLVRTTPGTDPLDRYFMLVGLAPAELGLGNYETAYDITRTALDDYDGPAFFDARLGATSARALARMGRGEEALVALNRAHEIFLGLGRFEGTAREMVFLRAKTDVLEALGRFQEALEASQAFQKSQLGVLEQRFDGDMAGVRATLSSELDREHMETELAEARLHARDVTEIMMTALILLVIFALAAQLHAAAKLRASQRQAEEANAAKSKFLANMSHELRTPLNAIIGFSEMMKTNTFGPLGHPRYEEYVAAVHNSGCHLLEIIEDILDLSRVEAGKYELDEESFPISGVIDEVCELISHDGHSDGVRVILDENVLTYQITGDRRLVKQAVLNLVSNSVKFTPADGYVRISVGQADGGKFVITVKDNGVGMSDDELEQAMKPFGQVQSAMTRRHDGSGLGIPLVRAFMELHGGDLDMRSWKGEGTRARLVFPASRVEISHPEETQAANTAVA